MVVPQNLRQNMRASLLDGLAYSLMVGFGETFFAAFALDRGASAFHASLISTVPLLAGAAMQLLAPWGIRWFKSYDRWAITMASCQAFGLALMAVLTQLPVSIVTIFVFVAIYWGTGLAISPAWNAWMSQLIPLRFRTQFFSSRSRWCHLFTFLGLVAGGGILQFANSHNQATLGFCALFILAAFSRTASVLALSLQTPSHGEVHTLETSRFSVTWEIFSSSQVRRLMVFLLVFQTMSNVASSLFTPYFLRELHLSYGVYMALLSCALLARFMTLAYAKPLIARLGLRGVFFMSLVLVSPIPYFYTLDHSLIPLILYQVISGMGWGFYELISFLTIFNDLPEKQRASVLAFFNLLQVSGIVLGSICGGLLFTSLGEGMVGYEAVFTVSSILRFAAWAALPGLPWHLFHLKTWIELRPISVRAHGGLLSRPILVKIPMPKRRRKTRAEKPLPPATGAS